MASRYFEFYQKKLLVKILEREYIDIKKKISFIKKKKIKKKRKKGDPKKFSVKTNLKFKVSVIITPLICM